MSSSPKISLLHSDELHPSYGANEKQALLDDSTYVSNQDVSNSLTYHDIVYVVGSSCSTKVKTILHSVR